MADSARALLVNSTAALVLAAVISRLLHESAHAVAGLLVGLTPTLTPFAVSYQPPGILSQQMVTALAGPLVSLALGLLLMGLGRHWGQGFSRLFWLWLAAVSTMNFIGYAVIAPVAPAGDLGRALRLGDASDGVLVGVGVLGAAGQFGLAWLFAQQVRRYCRDIGEERQVAFFPWLAGTAVNVVLTVVAVLLLHPGRVGAILVISYSVTVAVFAPMQFLYPRRHPPTYEHLSLERVSRPGLALAAGAALVVVLLAASGGLRLG